MNLDTGPMPGIMISWPMYKFGCKEDVIDSCACLGFDVSDGYKGDDAL